MLKLWMRLFIIVSIICTSFSPMTHLIMMLIAIITTQFLFLHFMTKLPVKCTLRNDSLLKLFREKTLICIELTTILCTGFPLSQVDILGFKLSSVTPYRTAFETIIPLTEVRFFCFCFCFYCVLELVLLLCESHSNQNNHLFKDFYPVKESKLLVPVLQHSPFLIITWILPSRAPCPFSAELASALASVFLKHSPFKNCSLFFLLLWRY